jgi:hypothetical protein
MSDKPKGQKTRQTKVSKANLGQKKAEREKAAESRLRHMGGGEKTKSSRLPRKK